MPSLAGAHIQIGKLSRMSHTEGNVTFDSDVGKIQINPETGAAYFDMGVSDPLGVSFVQ